MTRGGKARDRSAPERRCIATGETGPREGLIRFVLGPDARVVPDVAGKLPGRGVWLTADRALVEKAEAKRLFSRGFRQQATVPEGLADLLERLLAERLISIIALARKAGQAVTGYEKVKARLARGEAGLLVQAADGAEEGKAKLARLGADLPRTQVLAARELGLAFGRDFAIHAALGAGGIAERAAAEARRLEGLRTQAPATDAGTGARTGGTPAGAMAGKDEANGPRAGRGQDFE